MLNTKLEEFKKQKYYKHILIIGVLWVVLIIMYMLLNITSSPTVTIPSGPNTQDRAFETAKDILHTNQGISNDKLINATMIDNIKYNCDGCWQITIQIPDNSEHPAMARVTIRNWKEENTELF